ncbi:helix-turn-helix domain-containing protein [Lacticaseibacillus paracasei]|uniref:helix-turn-helix domain-containing protein n=1 Tax=Lacticaseibacillus paracasei TaxID=1597 RepID=UPI0026395AE4|nr:helix-turn-helix domain-containing protein [Lacticaseibacillus paracasei]MDN4552620.1 helix-turn-helix domain-containing protein [Lacticaseibacillus paracasei]
MLYEQTFLDRADLQKFQMFAAIKDTNVQTYTINTLSQHLDLSYQQGYNILQELFRDLTVLTKHPEKMKRKQISLLVDIDITVDDYHLYLLQHAIAFQFVDYIVQANHPSTDKFCRAHYISRSTLVRKTSALRNLLKRYQLKLSFSDLGFAGQESRIRLFLFAFYWIGYHGVDWPFKVLDEQKIVQEYTALPSAKKNPVDILEEVLFWAISRVRISGNHFVDGAAPFDKIFDEYSPFQYPVYTKEMFPAYDTRFMKSENDFFYFQQNRTITFLPTDATSDAFIRYLSDKKTVTTDFTKRLLAFLNAHVRPDSDFDVYHEHELVLNLARIALNNEFLGGDFMHIVDYYQPEGLPYTETKLYHTLQTFIAGLPNTPAYRRFLGKNAGFLRIINYLLAPYLRYFSETPVVQVKLVYLGHDLLNRRLVNFLDDLSVVDLLPDDAPCQEADLVITSVDNEAAIRAAAPSDFKGEVATWIIDDDDSAIFQLYMLIRRLYLGKTASARSSETGTFKW